MTQNLWHSCGRYPLSAHFKGKPRHVKQAFDRLVAVARACGPVTVYAQKTRIVIQARVRFAGGTARKAYFRAHLWLKRKITHPLLVHTESFGRLGYGHAFHLASPQDVDTALELLIREAYDIATKGDQENRGA